MSLLSGLVLVLIMIAVVVGILYLLGFRVGLNSTFEQITKEEYEKRKKEKENDQ